MDDIAVSSHAEWQQISVRQLVFFGPPVTISHLATIPNFRFALFFEVLLWASAMRPWWTGLNWGGHVGEKSAFINLQGREGPEMMAREPSLQIKRRGEFGESPKSRGGTGAKTTQLQKKHILGCLGGRCFG